jgi:hypothetical protein
MSNSSLAQVFESIDKDKDRIIQDVCDLVTQPSVSAQRKGMQQCAKIGESN